MESLGEEIQQEVAESVQDILEDYIENNALIFSKKNYLSLFTEHVSEYISDLAKTEGWYDEDIDDDFNDWIESLCMETFEIYSIPLRENSPYNPFPTPSIETTKNTLAIINAQPVQKQRTIEWHTVRQTLFSASSIWKLFSTEAVYNSLIYEKCKGLDVHKTEIDVLVPSARNWGIKYEPVTVMIYEHKHKTVVNTNYGCIPHPSLPIGASPDGIVCDESSEKYGRLVEIKNIYNREIDGIPSEEYWIQMQTQMEVCRLEICDFVETRIKEFATEEEYIADMEHEYKGIALFFISREPGRFESYFEYMPLDYITNEEQRKHWIDKTVQGKSDSHVLYQTSYWYLDQYSCTEVIRNDVWFSCAKPIIEKSWNTVLKERKEGYEHRAPQKKKINGRSGSMDETASATTIAEGVGPIRVIKLDLT